MTDFNLSELRTVLDDVSSNTSIMKSVDMEGIAHLINEGRAERIITMAGAGISTAAGIPDFRSPNSGIYDNLAEYNLPFPMAVFSIDFFHINPEPFFKVAKRLYRPDAKPTLAHHFVRLLHEKGLLKRHYTQNVDSLDRLANVPDDLIIEAHGSFHTGHCVTCKQLHSFQYMRDVIMLDKIPTCEEDECGGIVKPVAPFCTLVDEVGSKVPRLYLNREAPDTCFDDIPWDAPENKRDVFVAGDADDSVLRLATLLKWKDELLELKNRTDAKLDGTPTVATAAAPVTKKAD